MAEHLYPSGDRAAAAALARRGHARALAHRLRVLDGLDEICGPPGSRRGPRPARGRAQ
ncbi:hypothetical protein [Streptomyces hoynatensis]|uniref:hypothetical protein n=1 Tax=Streptomyces hoynatensis TaxID=1141874 RepID=UPI00131A080F|nr:hypothetical protein [Streptomyces hoynatensis]